MLGLALEGGGAKGAYHMGAIKALMEAGYEFDGVTGTSIGALNGAIIAQGDFEIGYKLWENMEPYIIFDIEESEYKRLKERNLDKDTISKLFNKTKNIIKNKGVNTVKIKQLLESVIDEKKLRNSKKDFGLVTVSLTDLKPMELFKEDINEGKMIDYLIASANFPGFKPHEIDNKIFIDGGLYDNCPINLLGKKGYKDIIAIRTLGVGLLQNVKYPDVKVTYITPSEKIGSVMDFSNDLIKINLKMGYFDATRVIRGLKGTKYYIEPIDDEKIFNALNSMTVQKISQLSKILRLTEMNYKRMLFEKIIPYFAQMLMISPKLTYQDVIIRIMENIAENIGINKYQVYSFNDFIDEVTKQSNNINGKSLFTENIDIAKRFYRNSMLLEGEMEFINAMKCYL